MTELPTWIVVLQWVLLLGLATLVIVIYRQFAYLLRLVRPGSADEALGVGERAARFDYRDARDPERSGTFVPGGAPTLLVFADPYCASCTELLAILGRLAREPASDGIRILVATDASSDQIAAVEAFRATDLEVARIDRSISTRRYRVELTPFVFAIDEGGVVRAHGTVEDERELRNVLRDLSSGSDGRSPEDGRLELLHHNPRDDDAAVKAGEKEVAS